MFVDRNLQILDDHRSLLFADTIWSKPQPGDITKKDSIADAFL